MHSKTQVVTELTPDFLYMQPARSLIPRCISYKYRATITNNQNSTLTSIKSNFKKKMENQTRTN